MRRSRYRRVVIQEFSRYSNIPADVGKVKCKSLFSGGRVCGIDLLLDTAV